MVASLFLPAFAILLIGLAVYGAGSLVHRAGSPLERWVRGLAAWVLTLFALASLGLFRPVFLQAFAVVLGLVGAVGLWRKIQSREGTSILPWPCTVGIFGVFGLPLILVFAVTVNPTVSWDAAVYHLTLPDLYLREGGFRTIPFLVYSVWPQAVELIFGVALALQDYVAAKALHFGFGVLAAVTLFFHAVPRNVKKTTAKNPTATFGDSSSRAGSLFAGIVAAGLFLLNDVVLFELRAAYVDLAMAFFALAGFLLLDRWLDRDESDRDDFSLLISAGLACGLLAATKINGVVTALPLLLLILPRLIRRAHAGRGVLRILLTLGLPIAVLWMPWVLRTWLLTGNPIYPLYWDVFGGPDWSVRLGEQFLGWQQSIGMGRSPLDYLLLPWRVFTAGDLGYETFDGRLTPIWLGFLPLALWRARTSRRARRALAAAGLIFLGWSLGSQQMRFLIPALPLLALAAADGVWGVLSLPGVARRLRSVVAARGLVGAALLAWFVAFGVTQTRLATAGWSHLKLYGDPRFERPEQPPRSPVFDEISQLPAESTVLLLNTNHLFHCRPTRCLANSFFEAPQVDAWLSTPGSEGEVTSEIVAKRMAVRGVTHVAWVGRPRFQHAPPILHLLDRPDLAQPVFSRGPDRLWQLTTRLSKTEEEQ